VDLEIRIIKTKKPKIPGNTYFGNRSIKKNLG